LRKLYAMSISKSYIPEIALGFLSTQVKHLSSLESANRFLMGVCGIRSFFINDDELNALKVVISDNLTLNDANDRREFGDYQTNVLLANKSVLSIKELFSIDYEFVLEPTCGKGNFIIAALENIKTLSKIVGIEIYQPYVWETKFKVLSFYLKNPDRKIIDINIIHADVFSYDFKELSTDTQKLKTLIIGNPPWITNSELGALASKNLPKKRNIHHQKGLDALTGKSNFDLGEAVVTNLFKKFQHHYGAFALLVKSIVAKNIVKSQRKNNLKIGNLKKLIIDAKSEFDVSVNASLFMGVFGDKVASKCVEGDFYTGEIHNNFGWVGDKFVSSVDEYEYSKHIDGISPLTWRSGIKHDCSKIMELDKINDIYINKLGEEISLEENLVHRLLKSSDLKSENISTSRKFTIVTQRKIGQDTFYIKEKYPNTYSYLEKNENHFSARRSSIYKGKPKFSIFGVGDYSFKLHKVAISGLYKKTIFSYIGPDNLKPIMLDDTCYFIGFDTKAQAKISQFLLNSQVVQAFLKSVVFTDSKRSINKDILMRIDLQKVYKMFVYEDASAFDDSITYEDWERFDIVIKNVMASQPTLF